MMMMCLLLAVSFTDDCTEFLITLCNTDLTRIWDNPYSGQVRLTGGDTVNEGLVEVYCNGGWGTVCDDYFDQVDGDTICRQLGYYSANRYNHYRLM